MKDQKLTLLVEELPPTLHHKRDHNRTAFLFLYAQFVKEAKDMSDAEEVVMCHDLRSIGCTEEQIALLQLIIRELKP
jgi:hypothetical protein